ncbi:hypothetical protein [Chishuiella sp.]|uniref:hypothetical protein n=1 Tax=Chishuiella sp. TaxID=1969467 RepID=UPI0028ACE0AB|nr:hypothetical protein [Chishuiella sp.]
MPKDNHILRNTIAVIIGLVIIYVIIQFGLVFNANRLGWDEKVFPEWRHIIKYFSNGIGKKHEVQFFGSMLVISGFAALVGGIITATIVKRAKQAYTMFVGFIVFLVALGDILITPNHPTWYEISICPVLFFSSWIGGLIVDLIYKKFLKKHKPISQSY